MNKLVIAALLGTLTHFDVQAVLVASKDGPNEAQLAAEAAKKAGVQDQAALDQEALIKSQREQEMAEVAARDKKEQEQRQAVEAYVKLEERKQAKVDAANAASHKTAEEEAKELQSKIVRMIEERKKINEAALEAAKRNEEWTKAQDEKRRFAAASAMVDEQKKLLEKSGVKPEEKALVENSESDESVDDDDDINDEASEEDVQVQSSSEDDEDDDEDDLAIDEDVLFDNVMSPEENAAAQALAQKSGHLHETDIRVDPPLLPDGKKAIAEAEKDVEEAKKDYDVKHAKAQAQELAFHAASRISKAAREERAKAEDRYYISSKGARKAARLAENLEREARLAAAKQAAADKYAEVISAANKEASAKDNARGAALAAQGNSTAAAK